MKGVQCYELLGGIALKNHTFSFSNIYIQINVYKLLIHSIYTKTMQTAAKIESCYHSLWLHLKKECMRKTNVSNPVASKTSEGGRIHLSLVAIRLTQKSTIINKIYLPRLDRPSYFPAQPAMSMTSMSFQSPSLPLSINFNV